MFFLSEVFAQEQNENEIVAVLRLLLLLLNLLRVCLCTPQTALFEKIHTLLLSVGEQQFLKVEEKHTFPHVCIFPSLL